MKKLLFLFAGLLFILCSCTKALVTPPVTSGTLTATIDGVDKTFNVSDSGWYYTQPNYYYAQVSGKSDASGTDHIFVSVNYQAPIKADTTYTNFTTGIPINVLMVFRTTIDGVTHYYGPAGSSDNPISVTITSISSTNVQGTFNGTLDYGNGVTTPVTNGKFNIDINGIGFPH